MPIYQGSNKIGDFYSGSNSIGWGYVGSNLVYQKSAYSAEISCNASGAILYGYYAVFTITVPESVQSKVANYAFIIGGTEYDNGTTNTYSYTPSSVTYGSSKSVSAYGIVTWVDGKTTQTSSTLVGITWVRPSLTVTGSFNDSTGAWKCTASYSPSALPSGLTVYSKQWYYQTSSGGSWYYGSTDYSTSGTISEGEYRNYEFDMVFKDSLGNNSGTLEDSYSFKRSTSTIIITYAFSAQHSGTQVGTLPSAQSVAKGATATLSSTSVYEDGYGDDISEDNVQGTVNFSVTGVTGVDTENLGYLTGAVIRPEYYYQFSYWVDSSGNKYYAGSSYSFSSNITLYAVCNDNSAGIHTMQVKTSVTKSISLPSTLTINDTTYTISSYTEVSTGNTYSPGTTLSRTYPISNGTYVVLYRDFAATAKITPTASISRDGTYVHKGGTATFTLTATGTIKSISYTATIAGTAQTPVTSTSTSFSVTCPSDTATNKTISVTADVTFSDGTVISCSTPRAVVVYYPQVSTTATKLASGEADVNVDVSITHYGGTLEFAVRKSSTTFNTFATVSTSAYTSTKTYLQTWTSGTAGTKYWFKGTLTETDSFGNKAVISSTDTATL